MLHGVGGALCCAGCTVLECPLPPRLPTPGGWGRDVRRSRHRDVQPVQPDRGPGRPQRRQGAEGCRGGICSPGARFWTVSYTPPRTRMSGGVQHDSLPPSASAVASGSPPAEHSESKAAWPTGRGAIPRGPNRVNKGGGARPTIPKTCGPVHREKDPRTKPRDKRWCDPTHYPKNWRPGPPKEGPAE